MLRNHIKYPQTVFNFDKTPHRENIDSTRSPNTQTCQIHPISLSLSSDGQEVNTGRRGGGGHPQPPPVRLSVTRRDRCGQVKDVTEDRGWTELRHPRVRVVCRSHQCSAATLPAGDQSPTTHVSRPCSMVQLPLSYVAQTVRVENNSLSNFRHILIFRYLKNFQKESSNS